MATSTHRYGIFDFSSEFTERIPHFTGRTWVFQEIDYWLGHPDAPRYFLLTGEPGSGKSAVAARLAQFSAGEVASPPACPHLAPGFLRAVHFCRATASDRVDPRDFARSLALQLAGIPEFAQALKDVGDQEINIHLDIRAGTVEPGGSVTGMVIENLTIQGLSGQDAFTRTVLDPLRVIYDAGYNQPTVILVDSLDESLVAATDVRIVDLLATVQALDKRVCFILTSRPEPRVENQFPSAGGLSLSDPAYESENHCDIADFVMQRLQLDPALASKAAGLPPAQRADLPAAITARADGNFQYVAFLLKAAASGQQALDNPAGLPSGLDALYFESLQRVVLKLGKKDWDTVYKPFLGVLSVAREPLTLELLQTFTGSATSLWNVYTDLIQFIETAPPANADHGAEERYRLYHQSIIDFLDKRQLVVWENGHMAPAAAIGLKKTKAPLKNLYYLEAADWHARVVAACEKPTDSWAGVDWSTATDYSLRHLVAHLSQMPQTDANCQKLHALLATRAFVDQHLARLGKPNLLLDDLRLALNLALQAEDYAQAWGHIREYRRVLSSQLDFEQLRRAVEAANQTGDYLHALERTALYGTMPNSQALARLWIAWNAAASGHEDEAAGIIKHALDRLPPRGTAQRTSRQAGDYATMAVEDAVGETLQRLLVRIAQTCSPGWLREALSPWPAYATEVTVARLSEPLVSWGECLDAGTMHTALESLFAELQVRGGHLDGDMPPSIDRERVYFYQRRLAAGLFNDRHDPQWLDNVRRAVALIALDDYPSYREVALAWVAVAVLAQEAPDLAREALAAVLGALFRPAPGFWGDTVAAAMAGMDRENNVDANAGYLLSILEHVEETGERSIDPNVPRKLPIILDWRRKVGLPEDPWSFRMRRRNAAAAVLHRQGDLSGAEALLKEASAESYEGSYAGYRALARLSLACRRLEWHRLPEATNEAQLAGDDAAHMRDHVLRAERLELVGKMRSWITAYGGGAALGETEALAQLQQKTGLERGLFIEFLSAQWCDQAPRLKRLLSLALDDATTADAVLGRLLGAAPFTGQPGRPFLELVKALHIDVGVETG